MKKVCKFLFSMTVYIVLIFGVITINTFAASETVTYSGMCGMEGDNLTWELYDTGELVISGVGVMADYSPGTAPWYAKGVQKVTIKMGVTTIGNYAFYFLGGLRTVDMPDTVKSIGSCAFLGSGITDIGFSANLSTIARKAFADCKSLTNVELPEKVVSLGSYCFSGCSNLESVTIPETMGSIGEDAFVDCTNLSNVYISDIGAWSSIEFATLNSNPLRNYTNSDPTYLYLNGETVRDIVIPDTVDVIQAHAFADCTTLVSVTISEGVTSIGEYAFWDCTRLSDITIPETLTYVGASSFVSCPISSVYITDLAAWCAIDFLDTPFRDSNSGGLYLKGELLREVEIPQEVTAIKQNVFYKTGITSVVLHENITEIGPYAFKCFAGESINIPDSVTVIGEQAFYYSNISSIKLSNNLKSIGSRTFGSCEKLKSITIPETLEQLGEYCFENSGLQSVTYQAKTVYKNAFAGCSSLEEALVSDSVEYIEDQAFTNCTALKTLVLGRGVQSIGGGAFYGCKGLENVYFTGKCDDWCRISFVDEASVPQGYGADVYFGNKPVTEVTIPEDVTTISPYAFYKFSSLTQVNMHDGIKNIGDCAFYMCKGLKKISLPQNLTALGLKAFYGCTNLTYVLVPENLVSTQFGSFGIMGTEAEETTEIWFKGNPPAFTGSEFSRTKANCYYPENNNNWTSDVKKDYGGTITWLTWDATVEEEETPGGGGGENVGGEDPDSTKPGGNGNNESEPGDNESGDGNTGTEGGNTGTEGGSGSGNDGGNTGTGSGTGIQISTNVVGTDTSGAVINAPTSGWTEGTNVFTVSCERACVVGASYDNGETYTELTATATDAENTYCFTVENVTASTVIVVALRGDVNGDGAITNADVTRLKAAYQNKIELVPVALLAADVNKSGGISNADVTKLKAVYQNKTVLSW